MWWNNGAVWIVWPPVSVCPEWFYLGLMPLKSIHRTECIVLPYNIRASTLWISLDGGILSCQKRTIQDNAYTISNKSFSIQKLIPQAEGRWTVIKMITVGKAQRTKEMTRTIFYRWYDQWTLSKSVKVEQSSKWGKFNSAQIGSWYFVMILNTRHFDGSWNLIKTQKRPTARHRVAGCCYWRALISE